MRVNVGVRVLGLAVLRKDAGSNLVHLADQLEHRVLGQVLLSELALGDVTGIRLAQNGVAITGHDTACLERRPEVLLDLLVAQIVANRGLHLLKPLENLLVGKSVKRTGQTVETGGEGEVSGAEGATDEVCGVSADVAALVVGVDGEIEAHQLNKVLVLGETELVGQVEAVVLVLLDGGNLTILVGVAVDGGSDRWELRDEVHRVIEGVLPVLGLGHALSIGLGERRLAFKSSHGGRELSHGVKGLGEVVEELKDVVGDLGGLSPLGGESANLSLGRDLASQEKPEETFWERLGATRGLGEEFLALWDLYRSD